MDTPLRYWVPFGWDILVSDGDVVAVEELLAIEQENGSDLRAPVAGHIELEGRTIILTEEQYKYNLPPLKQIERESVCGVYHFRGTFWFLSNFWPLPDGTTVEHRYQAAKCVDRDEAAAIMRAASPAAAKRLGRQVRIRSDWNSVRVNVMRELLRQKFRLGTPLAEALLVTRVSRLQEGNDWGDVFWGVCNGRGQNVLGKLLMRVREELILAEVQHSLQHALDDEQS